MGMSIGIADDWTHLRYSTFGRMRELLCAAAGYGSLDQYVGYGGTQHWSPEQKKDILVSGLLRRADDEDVIPHSICRCLAIRMRRLIPQVPIPIPSENETDQIELMNAFAAALERCAKHRNGLGWY
ncbi:MAG: hypothetical protein ACI856_002264 [Kiritimatiellia bacterium]|jgi:hypothetical protein